MIATLPLRQSQRLDPDRRRLTPEDPAASALTSSLMDRSSWWSEWYFATAERLDWASSDASLIMIQSSTDLAGLAIALEQQRRLTGRYPDSIEGVAASFSGALPRQIQSGEPYNYQRTADGGYRLSGDGLPGLNDTEKMRLGLIIVRPPRAVR